MHLESLVHSGWMLLDGWHYRALKRGKCACMARIARESCAYIGIAADSTQSGAASLCHVLPGEKRHIMQ
jgi:hypothetical protein